MASEKQLGLLGGVFITLLVLSAISRDFLLIMHGLSELLFGGTSMGKTFLTLGWFSVVPLIGVLFRRFMGDKGFGLIGNILFIVFLVVSAFGFISGYSLFNSISQDFGSGGPFISYIQEESHHGAELSWLEHNHFPKVALAAFSEITGITFPNTLDTGQPLYDVLDNSLEIGITFMLLSIIIVLAGVGFATIKANELGIVDYTALIAAVFGIAVLIVDGGMFSTYMIVALFFLLFFIGRNMLELEGWIERLFPLLGVSLYTFILGNVNYEGFVYASGWSVAVFLTAVIILVQAIGVPEKGDLIRTGALAVAAIYLLSISAMPLGGAFLSNAYGEVITSEAVIYVYGLPEGTTSDDLHSAASEFGEVSEADVLGWAGYFRLFPDREDYRARQIEDFFRGKFPTTTYLIAEYNFPVKRIVAAKFRWMDGVPDAEMVFRGNLLDLRVMSLETKGNETTVYVEGETLPMFQLMTIMAKVRESGYSGKVIAGRV